MESADMQPSLFEQEPRVSPLYPQTECMEGLCDGSIRTPGEAYVYYISKREASNLLWPEFYFSTTITSGGFLRNADLPFSEGIQSNIQLARNLADAIVAQNKLDPETIVLPTELGKVAGWKQADYLLFWYHILHGAMPEDALAIEKYFQTSKILAISEVMENKLLPYDLRKRPYFEFYKAAVSIVQNTEEGVFYDNRWVKKPQLIPLIDSDFSLGCIAERYWQPFGSPSIRTGELDLNEDARRRIRKAQLVGASVLGERYDRTSAKLWAEYYGATLVE